MKKKGYRVANAASSFSGRCGSGVALELDDEVISVSGVVSSSRAELEFISIASGCIDGPNATNLKTHSLSISSCTSRSVE